MAHNGPVDVAEDVAEEVAAVRIGVGEGGEDGADLRVGGVRVSLFFVFLNITFKIERSLGCG